MSKEKMVELKTKMPERQANFLEDMFKTQGLNRDKELRGWMMAGIEADYAELDPVDRIRLVEKYNVEDLYPIHQWERDEAAGISRKVEPTPRKSPDPVVREALVDTLAIGAAKVAWKLLQNMTPEEIERFKALTREELDERLKKPISSSPEDTIGVTA
jgi:hypothetical protein